MKYNNDKSRDYTRPELPAGDGQPALDVAAALSKDSSSLLGKIPGKFLLLFLLFIYFFINIICYFLVSVFPYCSCLLLY